MSLKEFNREVLYTDEDLVEVSRADIAVLKKKAMANDRKRIRLCSHRDVCDPLHEMLIVNTKGAYVRPHKHLNKSESFHMLEGCADVVLLDEQGHVTEVIPLGEYSSGRNFYYRIETSHYHTLIIHSDYLVFHETIKGPFQIADTVFPSWAPEESSVEACRAYMQDMAKRIRPGH